MGGFLSALGGAGQAASQYGQQVRNILEQNRSQFANFLTNRAMLESDPTRKGELLGHVSDLYGGKDIAKVGHAAIKTLQQHGESDAGLAQAFGGAPATPPQVPSPAGPGQTPGTATSPAAQPATSPVQPQAQGAPQGNIPQVGAITPPQNAPAAPGPVPPIGAGQTPDATAQMGQMFPGGVPQVRTPQEIVAKWRPTLDATADTFKPEVFKSMQTELEANQTLATDYQKSILALNIGLQRLGMLGSPQVQALMGKLKTQGVPDVMLPLMMGSALGIAMPPTMFSAAVGNPIKERFDAGSATPEQKAAVGLPADAKGEFTIERNRLSRQVENAYPGWVGDTIPV